MSSHSHSNSHSHSHSQRAFPSGRFSGDVRGRVVERLFSELHDCVGPSVRSWLWAWWWAGVLVLVLGVGRGWVPSLTEASGIGCLSSLLSGRLAPLLEDRLPWMVNLMILTPHDYNDYNNSNLLQLVLLDLELDPNPNLNRQCLLAFSSLPSLALLLFFPLHSTLTVPLLFRARITTFTVACIHAPEVR